MANLAAKEIFTRYMWAPQPLRSMLLKKDLCHKLLIEGVRQCRPDASAGGTLKLKLQSGTPVLAPADMRLTEADNQWYGSWAVFTGRKYIFSFYHLDLKNGMSTGRINAGSAIGTMEAAGFDPKPHLLMTVAKRRWPSEIPGEVIDAMALIEKGIIRPPFMPRGLG